MAANSRRTIEEEAMATELSVGKASAHIIPYKPKGIETTTHARKDRTHWWGSMSALVNAPVRNTAAMGSRACNAMEVIFAQKIW